MSRRKLIKAAKILRGRTSYYQGGSHAAWWRYSYSDDNSFERRNTKLAQTIYSFRSTKR